MGLDTHLQLNVENLRWEDDSAAPPQYACRFEGCTYVSTRESYCNGHMKRAHNWTYVRSKSNGRKKTPMKASKANAAPSYLPPEHTFDSSISPPVDPLRYLYNLEASTEQHMDNWSSNIDDYHEPLLSATPDGTPDSIDIGAITPPDTFDDPGCDPGYGDFMYEDFITPVPAGIPIDYHGVSSEPIPSDAKLSRDASSIWLITRSIRQT